MYRIFQYEGSEESRVDKLIGGDPISWLGIDRKDGSSFGMKGKLIIFQGNSDLMKNLESADLSFMKEIKGEEAEKVMQSLKEESDRAAGGLGFIFD
ncbi:MAG: hypothetical protein M1460_02160 [Candidatus Thermoplasmatota archaeon]|jgi:hypothetical protein|nr:hypothetical protein [Candidatus Thermoplasmatota archaeon]